MQHNKIAGIIHPTPFAVTQVTENLHALFKGHYGNCFRYKNLKIASSEKLPQATPFKRKVFFDGVLLNKKKLGAELSVEFGYSFKEACAEWMINHAYEIWGVKAFKHLEGPFALSIFDEKEESLTLARDPIGQKTLYWSNQGNYWLFATDLKALLATGIVPQTPSPEALAAYLFFGYVPQDLSLIQGVNKLLPGHYLKVNLEGQVFVEQFWSYSHLLERKKTVSLEEAQSKLAELLQKGYSENLCTEQAVGAVVSGDLGSTASAFYLSKTLPKERIRLYNAAFSEPLPAAIENAREISDSLFILPKSEKILPEQALTDLPQVTWHLDEPLADPYTIRTWHLASLAGSETNVLCTATGWEEMLGGAMRYYEKQEHSFKPSLSLLIARLSPTFRDAVLLPLLHLVGHRSKYHILRNIDINAQHVDYIKKSSLFSNKERYRLSPLLYDAFKPEIFSQRFHKLNLLENDVSAASYYDIKTRLPDNELAQFERLCSAHGLILFTPFLNLSTVEFLASVPDEIKSNEGRPAALLEPLAKKFPHLPISLEEDTSSFLDTWRYNPSFRQLFTSLAEGRLVEEGFISSKWIKKQLGYPYIIPQVFLQFWSLLTLEVWFRLFIDTPIQGSPPELSTQQILNK